MTDAFPYCKAISMLCACAKTSMLYTSLHFSNLLSAVKQSNDCQLYHFHDNAPIYHASKWMIVIIDKLIPMTLCLTDGQFFHWHMTYMHDIWPTCMKYVYEDPTHRFPNPNACHTCEDHWLERERVTRTGLSGRFCKNLLLPGFEPQVSSLQDRHANHYTTAAYTTQQFCPPTGWVRCLSRPRSSVSSSAVM